MVVFINRQTVSWKGYTAPLYFCGLSYSRPNYGTSLETCWQGRWAALTLWYPRTLQEALFIVGMRCSLRSLATQPIPLFRDSMIVISSLHEYKQGTFRGVLPTQKDNKFWAPLLCHNIYFIFHENVPVLHVQQRRRNLLCPGGITKHGEQASGVRLGKGINTQVWCGLAVSWRSFIWKGCPVWWEVCVLHREHADTRQVILRSQNFVESVLHGE